MTLLGLAIAVFAIGLDGYIVAAVLPAIADDLGESIAAVGLLVSAYSLPTALLAPVFGPLSDRRGRRFALTLGLGIFSAAAAACVIAPTLPLLLLARVANGVGSAIALPAAFAAAGDLPTNELRAKSLSLLSSMFPLSTLLGLPIGALVAIQFGWRGAFAFILLVALISAVLVTRLPDVRRPAVRMPGYFESLRRVVQDRRAVAIMLLTFVWFAGTFGLFTYLAEFVHVAFAVPTDQAGLIFIVVGLVGVAATRVSPRVQARVGPRRAVMLAIGLFVVGASLLPLAPSLPVAIVLFAVWAFGTWLGVPAQQTIVAGLSERSRGTMVAFNSSALNLGFVIGPIVTGRVIEGYGFGIGALWAVFLGVLALGIAWAVLPRHVTAVPAGTMAEA
jgi:MFS transporter, DHA1 family, inner membrane transport protein